MLPTNGTPRTARSVRSVTASLHKNNDTRRGTWSNGTLKSHIGWKPTVTDIASTSLGVAIISTGVAALCSTLLGAHKIALGSNGCLLATSSPSQTGFLLSQLEIQVRGVSSPLSNECPNKEETMQRHAIYLAVGLGLLIGMAGSTPASAYYYRHHHYRYYHHHHYYNHRNCYWSHHHHQCRYW
jgi:hypothetical protein